PRGYRLDTASYKKPCETQMTSQETRQRERIQPDGYGARCRSKGSISTASALRSVASPLLLPDGKPLGLSHPFPPSAPTNKTARRSRYLTTGRSTGKRAARSASIRDQCGG